MPPYEPARDVDAILAVLRECDGFFDSAEDGDPLPVLDHSLQCAAVLALCVPGDEELIAAGLVHDVGHRLVPARPEEHGEHAATFVAPVLGPRVAHLVALHVPAKRYLVATDPAYALRLSVGSTATLVRQGGPLDDAGIAAFAADPELHAAVSLRQADEAAKVLGRDVGDLERWRPLLERVAAAHAG